MQQLHETLLHRAGRGTPVGADTMIGRVATELRGQEAPRVGVLPEEQHELTTQPAMRESTPPPTPPRQPRWRAAAAFGAAFLIVLMLPTAFFVVAASDSATIYTTQVSPDTTNWFTVDVDTVAIGEAEATEDFGDTYAGFAVRVIQDQITAGTWSEFGAAWVSITE